MKKTPDNRPRHVAIIMDGNGRWASLRGLPRVDGHRAGVLRTEDIIDHAQNQGIPYLTLYAFSRENWDRPAGEVSTLMVLLKDFLSSREEKMIKNGLRLNAIGNLELLPPDTKKVLDQVMASTAQGEKMVLTLALSYGSRDEILRAVGRFMKKDLPFESLTESEFSLCLDTYDLPDVDLVIRTSGEYRVSNFLLWQGAYAEYYFDECHWPDFSPGRFDLALAEYQKRERRFGLTGEQIRKKGSL